MTDLKMCPNCGNRLSVSRICGAGYFYVCRRCKYAKTEDVNQTAKQDAGKPRPSLVPSQIIWDIAQIQQYDDKANKRMVPEFIKKSKIKDKGIFRCPYCGRNFEAWIANVMQERQHSCGCMKGEFAIESRGTHGDSNKRLYRIYHHILDRCNNPKCKEYKWYGAKGVKCEFNNYQEFKDFALTHGYSDDLTVERIDANGNYSAENIEFIPLQMQAWNTTRNVFINYKGLNLCASQWSDILGINKNTLTKRKRSGWTDKQIVETNTHGEKTPITYVPPQIIADILAVRKWSLMKYHDPDNWRTVEIERYIDALYRHFLRFLDNPKGKDEESGLEHYKHMACNMAFICEMMAQGKEG